MNQTNSEPFGDAWVWTSNKPITLEEWERYNLATFRYTQSDKFYTELQTMEVNEGRTKKENYSHPNIVTRVKWFVTYCCTDGKNEILGAYCYAHKQSLTELCEFLVNGNTSNIEDRDDAIRALSKVHASIS